MGHHVVLHRRLQPRRDEPLEPLPPILPRRTTALRSARSDPHACSHAAFGMHPSATTPASRVSTFSSTSMTEGMVDDGLGDDAKAERRRGRRSSFPRQHGTNDDGVVVEERVERAGRQRSRPIRRSGSSPHRRATFSSGPAQTAAPVQAGRLRLSPSRRRRPRRLQVSSGDGSR